MWGARTCLTTTRKIIQQQRHTQPSLPLTSTFDSLTNNYVSSISNSFQTLTRKFTSLKDDDKQQQSVSAGVNDDKWFDDDEDEDNFKVVTQMTNQELQDNSTIPGWSLVHSPPKTRPRGALVGTVVSDLMQKTINVEVDRYRIVPKYRKRLRFTRKFMAHDEKEVANMGDVVLIVPCQRISKRKHFMLREIIRARGQL